MQRHAVEAKRMAAGLGEVLLLMMRTPKERNRPIADLERLVLPAVVLGQFALADAQSRKTGATAPVAAVLWAFVSPEVDKRLAATTGELQLAAEDWRSGDIPWIVMTLGNRRVLGRLLGKLARTVFADRPPKIRARTADGSVTVGILKLVPTTDASPATGP